MSLFDEDKAAVRCSRMWRKLGGLLEKAAYANAERGFQDSAIRCARFADVCYWQATGSSASVMWTDVLPPAVPS